MSAVSNADRVQRVDLAVDTWDGVVKALRGVFSRASGVAGADIQVVPAATPEDFEQELQRKGLKLQLPLIVANMTNFEVNDQSLNRHLMRRDGYQMQVDQSRQWWTFLRAMPTVITFQVMLVSDDFLTMVRMAERWVNNERWNFNLEYDDVRLAVRVLPDKSLAIPARSPSSGGGEQYRLVANLRAETYSGYVWLVPAIRVAELTALFPVSTLAQALEDGLVPADGYVVYKNDFFDPADHNNHDRPPYSPVL